MLQNKSIKKISELKNGFTHRWLELDFIIELFGAFKFTGLIKSLNKLKLRGYNFESLFSILIALPFIGENSISSLTSSKWSKTVEAHKDTFYRLKNNSMINWRNILWLFACRFVKAVKSKSENTDEIKCLIIDDSMLSKTGKLIEKIGKVWDHVTNRSVLGFKLLLMGYWDGFSFIPIDFSLHREKGKNKDKPYGLLKRILKKQFRKKRQVGSPGKGRIKELDLSKVESALQMFKRAISKGFRVDYVLMDSWFTCEAFIKAVRAVKKQTVHLIGMYKIARAKFEYLGKPYTYSQIRNMLGKPKRCRKARLYYLEAQVLFNGMPVKLFFSRQGKNGKWKVFLTTDMKISFLRMVEIYQIRWTIEVFFKESKQLLGLGKCQASDFDGQVAETTITLIQYILLTLRYRFDKYESKGALFRQAKVEVFEIRLSERLWGLLLELLKLIEDLFDDVDEMRLMEKIFNNEKAYNKICMLIAQSEESEYSNAA
ncbi:MAG: transposase [Bacteroidales bacterium]|nr:transposase [Bacteroidales bacterium]